MFFTRYGRRETGLPSSTRPVYQEVKTALVEMQKQSRQDVRIIIPKSDKKRLNDQLDPELRECLEW